MSDDKTNGFIMDPETGDVLEGPPIPHEEMSKIIIGYIATAIINRAADQVTPPENPIKDIRRRRSRAEGLFLDAMASGLVSYSTYIENTFTWPEEEKRACIIEIKSRIEQAEEDLHKFYNGETWAEMRPLLMKTFSDICEEDAAGLLFSGLANSLKDYLPDLVKKVEAYNHETGGRITFEELSAIKQKEPGAERTREDGLLYWFIHEIDQERAAALKAGPGYFLVPDSKPTNALSQATRKTFEQDPITGRGRMNINGVTIEDESELPGIIGIDAHKLLSRAENEFILRNHHGELQTRTVTFFDDEYFRLLSDNIIEAPMDTPKGQEEERKRATAYKMKLRKTVRKTLVQLGKSNFDWVAGTGKNAIPFAHLNLIQDWEYPPGGGAITITFSEKYAAYLSRRRLWRLPASVFSWDARKSSAYAALIKIAYHHSSLNNYQQKTADILSVPTLLKVMNLRSIEKVREQGGSWKRVIRGPFEDALNELVTGGYLSKWEYSRAKGQPLNEDPDSAFPVYEKWADAYIKFKIAEGIAAEDRARDVQNRIEKRKNAKKKTRKKDRAKG